MEMCWKPQFFSGSGKNVLHLKIADRWIPYQSTNYAVPDYEIKGGSLGWATYQSLLKQGWKVVAAPKLTNE